MILASGGCGMVYRETTNPPVATGDGMAAAEHRYRQPIPAGQSQRQHDVLGAAAAGNDRRSSIDHAIVDASRVVIGGERGHQVGRGRAHAVEQGERAVAVPEQAQMRHHPLDRGQHAARRLEPEGGEGLAQRQEVEQEVDQQARIAREMPAIGEDLVVEFVGKQDLGPLAARILPVQADRGEGDGDQPVDPVGPLHRAGETQPDPVGQARDMAQEALVEGVVGAFQQQRRMGEEGDQPPRGMELLDHQQPHARQQHEVAEHEGAQQHRHHDRAAFLPLADQIFFVALHATHRSITSAPNTTNR